MKYYYDGYTYVDAEYIDPHYYLTQDKVLMRYCYYDEFGANETIAYYSEKEGKVVRVSAAYTDEQAEQMYWEFMLRK